MYVSWYVRVVETHSILKFYFWYLLCLRKGFCVTISRIRESNLKLLREFVCCFVLLLNRCWGIVTVRHWHHPKSRFTIPTRFIVPPDPISPVCSLTGKYILLKHFTYRKVQIFKIILRRFLFSKIWSSTQDYALLVWLLNAVCFFISYRPRWSPSNNL